MTYLIVKKIAIGKILYARERVRAPEMAEQVCTYLPALLGILTKKRI